MTLATTERARSTYIGASEAAAVVGLSRWDSPVGVWSRKVGIAVDEKPTTLAMWLGTRMEDIVRELYEARTGRKPRRHQRLVIAKDIPYIGAHPDYYQLEVKTSRSDRGWGDDGTVLTADDYEAVPIDYYLQLQQQLFCTGWERTDVAVLIGHDEFRTYEVERNPLIIDLLVSAEVELWEKNVLTNEPPPMDDSDAARNYLRQRFGRDLEPLRPATPEELPLLADAFAAAALKKAATKDYEVVANRLKLAIGDARGLTDGRLKATWTPVTRHDIDSAKVRDLLADRPDDLAAVSRERTGRTLYLTVGKED